MTTPTIARLTGPYGARLDRKTYWRLVMPGEVLQRGDIACISLSRWHTPPVWFRNTSYAGATLNTVEFTDLYRRRVKAGRKG